ncbi:unnamed protein product [Boreogadus saida]
MATHGSIRAYSAVIIVFDTMGFFRGGCASLGAQSPHEHVLSRIFKKGSGVSSDGLLWSEEVKSEEVSFFRIPRPLLSPCSSPFPSTVFLVLFLFFTSGQTVFMLLNGRNRGLNFYLL